MASNPRFSRRHASEPGNSLDHWTTNSSLLSSSPTSPDLPFVSRALSNFSFTRSRAVSIPENEDLWGSYGLNLLYSPPEPLVDLVFVHGLRGGSIKTWCKGNDLRLFWPQTWLPREPDLQHVRIHSFGYNADWKETKATTLDIHDFGRSLFGDLSTSPHLRHNKETRIILIGHSMGGLVMKKAFLLCQQDPESRELADRIEAMFFLATPHRGSDSAKLLNNILRASTAHSSQKYITDLSRNSTSLQIVSDEFRMVADQLQLWSFYETLKTKISSSTSLLIVDRDSAVLGFKNEKVQLLNADHRGVCKFESPADPNYREVRNSLAKAVESILGDVIVRKEDETRVMIGNLEVFLGIDQFADDDLTNLQSLRSEGSCTWITESPMFQGWRDSSDSMPLAYWLKGQPGCGKSVTSSHVVIHLQELGLDVCYYFFRHGNKQQQNASAFLRQLAYQMASRHPAIRQRLCALQDSGVLLDKENIRSLWRKLFTNEILKAPLPSQQFWIVDGLDECPDIMDLSTLLSNMEAAYPINIFFSSRKVQALERQILAFRDRLCSHNMEPNDTLEDIRSYIEGHCDNLAVDLEYRDQMVDTMLKKSDGSFLWTRLAFEELEQVYSEDSMAEVLEEIPEGMSALYTRVLDTMAKNAREIKLTRAILVWTACAVRDLTAIELQAAIKLDLNNNIPNVERMVGGLCGQLVRIEKSGLVQLTHATVRDFLMGGCPDSPFAITRGEAHERLAEICLLYLSSDELRPPKTRALISDLKNVQSPFADYAAVSWSDHLMAASSQSDKLMGLVSRFLENNVLGWIELIVCRKRHLHHISRAAKNLRNYLDRRAKYVSPLGSGFAGVSQWATDLLRIVAKFGRNLLRHPSAIYFIVPPLCPTQSNIHKQFATGKGLLLLEGFANASWGDCISYIEHRDTRVMSLAGGDDIFAIGLKSGYAKLYHGLTCQEMVSLHHGESVRLSKFDHASQHIATSGNTRLKMWDVSGQLKWSVEHKTTVVSLTFSEDDQLLVACTRLSGILSWRVIDGMSVPINPILQDTEAPSSRPNQAILSSSISPDLRLLAIAYRGYPPQIWSLEKDVLVGACKKEALSVSQVLFNPNPNVELLAVTYQDGELAIFDPWSQEESVSVSGDAYIMASTSDGRTLATGDMLGTIKLWDFETLHLLYCIRSADFEIRALAFSGNGLRLFDMRESKCKIWEPAALLRKTVSDDSSISESASGNEVAATVGNYGETVAITAMLVSHTSKCIFLGKDDGTMYAFDTPSGTLSQLYSHPGNLQPTAISWNVESQQLAISHATSIVFCHPEKQNATWKITSRISEHKWPSRIKDIALQPKSTHVLVLDTQETLTKMGIEDNSIQNISLSTLPAADGQFHPPASQITWRTSAGKENTILAVDEEGNLCVTSTAGDIASVQLLDSKGGVVMGAVRRLALDDSQKYMLLDMEESRHYQKAARVLIYDADILAKRKTGPEKIQVKPFFCLHAHEVRSFLGFYGTKIAFLDKKLWVRSYDLARLESGNAENTALGSEASKHFFIPFELVGGNNGVDGAVTEDGDVVFPKEGELVIVRNALTWSI